MRQPRRGRTVLRTAALIAVPAAMGGGRRRDVWNIRRMGLTVYARAASPRTAVGLKKAKEIDDRERGMFPFIREHKSIQKAIEIFNRI